MPRIEIVVYHLGVSWPHVFKQTMTDEQLEQLKQTLATADMNSGALLIPKKNNLAVFPFRNIRAIEIIELPDIQE